MCIRHCSWTLWVCWCFSSPVFPSSSSYFLSFSSFHFPFPYRSFCEWRIPPAAIRRVLRACVFALAWLCLRHADTWMRCFLLMVAVICTLMCVCVCAFPSFLSNPPSNEHESHRPCAFGTAVGHCGYAGVSPSPFFLPHYPIFFFLFPFSLPPNRSFWEWHIPPAAIRRVLRACLFALAWLCLRHADTWM